MAGTIAVAGVFRILCWCAAQPTGDRDVLRWLMPRFPVRQLPAMIRTALFGAGVAAVYGAIHDQLSYTISSEYFTHFKCRQFAWADLGWPPRLFAAEVGALAAGGVGLAAGWLLARAGLAELPTTARLRRTVMSFAIVTLAAAAGGLVGWAVGSWVAAGDLSGWAYWQRTFRLSDLPGFVEVAYLHAGGHLGALLGLVLAIVHVRRVVRRFKMTTANTAAPLPTDG